MTPQPEPSRPVDFWRSATLVLAVEAVTLLALWGLQSWFTIQS